MRYIKPADLAATDVGKKMHIDFFRRSFRSAFDDAERLLDRVTLKIVGKDIEFLEHRTDDGFNNWFSQQSLVSTDRNVTIEFFTLVRIEKKVLAVKAHLKGPPYEQDLFVAKSDIAELLIKVD